MRKALITGIAGQDGSYLAEFLLEKGYEVFGLVRRSVFGEFERIQHIMDKVRLVQGDVIDQSSVDEAIRTAQPDEVYNLAGLSFVPLSWNQTLLTANINGLGVARVLDAIRKYKPDARFYQASSSEMYGKAEGFAQNESAPFHPLSPYGVAKAYGHWITVNYRESFNIYSCSGICFNHESPRRGLEFVPRKVTNGVARIKLGLAKQLKMGNMNARRDWGFAGDYVKAMWLMLQQDQPDDYVIATGTVHSVRELVEIAFEYVELDWEDYVVTDPQLLRPLDIELLIGDASKAREKLGWSSTVPFEELVKMMVDADLRELKKRNNSHSFP